MKRLFSLLLAFAMVLSLMPMGIQQAKATEVAEGDGTSAQSPVFIDTEEEWVYYLNNTTGFASKHESQHTWYFKLTADIVLDAVDEENGDTVDGTVGYTSTGKTTVVDLNGFTVTANGGTARFMAANSAGSNVTMKNGSVIINRTGTSNNGSVFFISTGSHLTLENMTVTEKGASKYTGNGELLYVGTNKSSATIKNTVIEANTTNNSSDNAIYVYTNGASLDIQDSTILETVHVTTTGVFKASGATEISKLNLAYTASAQAKADLSGLTEGARVHVAAGETAFTAAFENAENVLPYVRSVDVTKKIAVSDNALILVAEEAGDGSAEKPWLITSEADYVEHIFTNTTESGYYKLKADVVLDAAKDDEVNGNQNGSATGRSICIDLDGYTISAVGTGYRFFSCGAKGDLTLKNGTVIVKRTYNNSFGATFNILGGGKLTLENMYVSEIGTAAFGHKGELLCVTDGSVVNVINTVMEADTTNNTSERTVNIEDSEVTFQNSEIRENVYVDSKSNVTVSGATNIESVDLTSGALLNAGALTEGAQIGITAEENAAFTAALGENAESMAACFVSCVDGLQVQVTDSGALMLGKPLGSGTQEDPLMIGSEALWLSYLQSTSGKIAQSEQTEWYITLTADIVLDGTDEDAGDTVDSRVSFSSTGKSIVIDFNSHTVTANGGDTRFISAASKDAYLTMKNGSLTVKRTNKKAQGLVFNIDGGHLTLESMTVTEQGTAAYETNGELLYLENGTAVLTDTVMTANVENSTSENAVYVSGSSLTINGGQINNSVVISDDTSEVTVSGAAKLAKLDLTAGAKVAADGLTDGASICVTAVENAAFTEALTDAAAVAAYFTTDAAGMQVGALEDNTLALVARSDGSGATAEDPIYIDTNEEWIEYLVYGDGIVSTSQQLDWYFVLRTDLRIRTGAYAYGASGKNITIDFDGHTMNSANGSSARFMRIVNGSLTMKNGTLEENGVSTNNGAVFALEHSDLILENMKVDEYSATAYKKRGEIIYATASNITLKNTDVTGVFTGADTDYGAIYLREDTASGTPSVLTMVNSSLSCTETGTVGKGGWITAGLNTSVVMKNSQISGGAAEMGGNVYIGKGATLTMQESTISGGTAVQGADLYLLGSAVMDTASVTGAIYAAVDADLEAPSGALVTNMTTGEATLYATAAEAAAAYTEGNSIKLFESTELALSCDAVVDLNGKNITITGTGETKITAFDSANSDFVTYGTLSLNNAKIANSFETLASDGLTYYMLSTEGVYSFHRLETQITSVSLRTTTGGIYFKGVWYCDDALKAQIETFGVAVSLRGMPGADFATSEDCLWTMLAGEELESGKEMTGVLVDGVIKKDREPELNDAYGRNYSICAATYVVFNSGETLVSDDPATTDDDVAVSLYSVVDGIEQMIATLEGSKSEDEQQLAAKYVQLMNGFYADWKDYGLESWGREEFTEASSLSAGFGRASIAPDAGTYSILGGNSIGRVTTETDGTEVSVTCVAVQQRKETFLLYTVDVISVSSTWATPMKNAISAATGVAKENILISTTHTHSGVGVNYDWADHEADKAAYMEKFYAAAVTAGTDAIADLAQAQVLGGSVATEGLAHVRHTSADAQVNGQLDLVQLQREDKKDIVLMSFPVHATFMESGTVLSADFPGYARAYVEANSDAQVAYFIGSGGNQTPTSGDSAYNENAADCKAYGDTLGGYVVSALSSGLTASEKANVECSSVVCTLDTNTLTEAELAKLDQAKEVKTAAETYGNTSTQAKLLVTMYGFESVYQAKAIVTRSTLSAQKDMTIKVLSLSRNVAFVFAPYEMFSNEGLALKAASPYSCTFIATCSMVNNGYIPSDYAWEINDCYEVQVTRWAQGTAGTLVEKYTEILEELKSAW